MEFKLTKLAIRLAEQAVVRRPPLRYKDDALRALSEEVLFGPWLILSGLEIIWRRCVWGVVASMIFLTFFRLMEDGLSLAMIIVALALGVGCVYFGLPSRTVLAGVSELAVKDLAAELQVRSSNAEALERLSLSIQLVRTQVMDRLARFNVVMSLSWGALFWFIGARILSPSTTPDLVQASFFPAIGATLVFLAVLIVASSYAAAVRVVYQTLDFALIEAKAGFYKELDTAG